MKSEESSCSSFLIEKEASMPKIILIVDDQEDALLVMKRTMKKVYAEGKIFTASSGDRALEMLFGAEALKPDLMFLDIKMPRVDGFEVLRRMRANEATKDIAVVVLSSSTYDGDIKTAESLNAEYMTKPLDVMEFRKAMAEVVGRYL
jgi:CheY-like chemotaxis protein